MRLGRCLTVLFLTIWSATATAEESATELEQRAESPVPVQEAIAPVYDELPLRFTQERNTEYLEYVITPHRSNYILPFSYQEKPNNEPWSSGTDYLEENPFENTEIKLQISFKVPLLETNMLHPEDGVYFGFTMKSFWQAYNSEISAPFRETNYRPEIFYQTPINLPDLNGAFFFRTGFEHESNGRSQLLSRSWNRAYVGLGFIRPNWAIYIQPWYRIPEDEKVDDGDPSTPPPAKGDDNPDIEDYYGHFELKAAYERSDYQIGTLIRSNTKTHKGAFELSYSFPLHGRLRGLVQYFDGYGESLIDYNYRMQRYSVGILLTDFL